MKIIRKFQFINLNIYIRNGCNLVVLVYNNIYSFNLIKTYKYVYQMY